MVYSCVALCLFPAMGSRPTFDNALKTAACCFEVANQYELAEEIYQRVPDKWIYSTLASWQTCRKKEDPRRFAQRNIAVAHVYGSNSVQMGDRYFYIASNCLNHDDTGIDGEISHSWLEKAKKIYEENNASSRLIDCLGQMAVIKENQNNVAECTALIKKAAALTLSVGGASGGYYCYLLEGIATKKGLNNENMVFSRANEKGPQLAAASYAADDRVRPYAVCLVLMLSILASGLGQATLSEFSLERLNRNLMKKFLETADSQFRFALLNTSISIDLMQNNVETALAKSEYLLQLAHGNSLTSLNLPSSFDWLGKRNKAIFTREIFAAALTTVIIGMLSIN
ncbi:MAG: hypothetical protein P4L53_26670 [Candidatus Obscuribacterales bacterium]|nr:hypothetical protein [Candidatus Obscuribacterales bacterium]